VMPDHGRCLQLAPVSVSGFEDLPLALLLRLILLCEKALY